MTLASRVYLQGRRQPFSRFAVVLHRRNSMSLEQTAVTVAIMKRCSQRQECALVETGQVVADVLNMLWNAHTRPEAYVPLERQLARNRVLYLLGPSLRKAMCVGAHPVCLCYVTHMCPHRPRYRPLGPLAGRHIAHWEVRSLHVMVLPRGQRLTVPACTDGVCVRRAK